MGPVSVGCSRQYYRERADAEARQVISEKSADARWQLSGFDIEPDSRSRFHDPTLPDCPPMPPDDPAAQYMAPRPQAADEVLEAPAEGRGYLDLIPVLADGSASVARHVPASFEVQEGGGAGTDPLLPPGTVRHVLSPGVSYQVALINSREYQERKESLFLTALDVTLERYAFAPQFFVTQDLVYEHVGRGLFDPGAADIRPEHLTLGPGRPGNVVAPGESPSSEAPNGQSVPSFAGPGPLAGSGFGVGKLLCSGGALLLRFANETVWEFAGPFKGRNSQSLVSLDFVQPLLQGGGKAVTLEPLTQAERNLLYEVRSYGRFQREFFVSVLTGADLEQGRRLQESQESDQDAEGNRRRVGFLPLVEQLQILVNEEQNLRLLEAYERQFEAFQRAGEVSLLQLDQVRQDVALARSRHLRAQQRYFNNLDRFKIQLGLPTQLPLVLDSSVLRTFALDPKDCTLPHIPESLPPIPYDLENAMAIALNNRLDLMNARAILVDYWRKIEVGANGLLGILDLEYHGEWLTPDPDRTSKPFKFSRNRARHIVSLKTELPLVRKAERNVYRTTLIEYQAARRSLMEFEDTVRLEVRDSLRRLYRARQDFDIQRNAVILACRRVDQSRRLLELPPPPGERRQLGPTAARDLLEAQRDLVDAQNRLVEVWVDFQTARLELLRDLELLDPLDPGNLSYGNHRDAPAPQLAPVPEAGAHPATAPTLEDSALLLLGDSAGRVGDLQLGTARRAAEYHVAEQ